MGNTLPLPVVMGVASTSYVASSIYFLLYPMEKCRVNSKMMHVPLIAHRGGAAECYENTLLAFRKAVDSGAGMLELDVRLSKDGQVVVVHDKQLLRLTGISQEIGLLNFSELPPLKSTIPIDFCPGENLTDNTVHEEERKFTLLSRVLEECPSVQVNIDIKDGSESLIDKVNEVVSEAKAEERCVWGNFSKRTTELCYAKNPRIGLLFSSLQFVKLYILFYIGLLPFVRFKETHLEIPMPSIFLNEKFRSKDGNVGMAKFSPWIVKAVDWLLMSPQLFLHLNKRGITVYLWVLNTEDQFEKAFNLGVNGVMTDYPTRLKHFLEKKQK